jgi:riboflavin synthase
VSKSAVSFDIMQESLGVTNLGKLEEGDLVNIERAAQFGDEIGGHMVSGHVDAQVEIVEIESPENNRIVTFALPREYVRFVFKKGFIALDGASLTVARLDRASSRFSVYLIPETLRRTTLGRKGVGDLVNIEIDRATQAIVETVAMLLEEGLGAPWKGRVLEE